MVKKITLNSAFTGRLEMVGYVFRGRITNTEGNEINGSYRFNPVLPA